MTVDRFLRARHLPLYLALAGIILALPSLWTGWQQDDIPQRYYLLGNPAPTGETVSALDMFAFLDGDSATVSAFRDLGGVPWWTYTRLRLAFWRPLSGVTHWLDYQLWPGSALLMHAQSLAWFGALIMAVAFLYRRFFGATWAAGCAAVLYALDDARGLPAGWLANRNALIAALFGVLALLAHDAWRRNRQRSGALLAPSFLALGLLAGETAFATTAFLAAYALFMDQGTVQRRFASLIPCGIITVVWLVVYHTLGYGTQGSAFYVDPLSQPSAFLGALLQRGPILLMDQWAIPPSSLYMFLSAKAQWILWGWALAVCLGIGALLYPILRRSSLARFWCAGMLLSVPIVSATTPHSRLLFFIGLGGMGLLAMWFEGAREVRSASSLSAGQRFLHRTLWVTFIIMHLVIAPILLPLNAVSAAAAEFLLQKPAREVDLGPGISAKDLILVNPPNVLLAGYFGVSRILDGLPVPRHQRALASGNATLSITRRDSNTLVIRPDGGFLADPFDNVFRAAMMPLRAGDRIELTNMEAQVLEVGPDGRPSTVAFRFGVPLEDTSLRWLRWENGRWITFVPPPVGQSLILPRAMAGF